MKKSLLWICLLVAVLWPAGLLAQVAYAVLDPMPSGTEYKLTFYYDDKINDHDVSYDLGPFELDVTSPIPSVNSGWSEYSTMITNVVFDASFADYTDLTSTAYWFYDFMALTDVEGIENLKTPGVEDMKYMFHGCSELLSLDLGGFDTSNVKDMSYMFFGCSGLDEINLTSFNTAKVTDMSYMFFGCMTMEELDLSSFDTSKVTNMESMFSSCTALTTIYASNLWSTVSVTNGDYMFVEAPQLVGGNGTEWDENFTDYTYAQIDKVGQPGYFTEKVLADPEPYAVISEGTKLTFYYDTHKEDYGDYAYDLWPFEDSSPRGWNVYRETITEVEFDVSFADCMSLTSTAYWFSWCSNLTTITGIENLKTDNVTDMSNMFYGCYGLTSLDVSGFKTDNVTDMSEMFEECSGLTSLNLSGFKTDNVTNMNSMFYGCSNLTSLDVSGFKTDNVTDMSGLFEVCSGLTSLNLSGFKTDNVTNMNSMFYGCSNLTSLDVSGFKTDNVTDMSLMFAGCSGLTSLDVSGFNTANVTNMSDMFISCSALTSLDVSNFNTANVTSMYGMFAFCSGLTSLDVSGFKTDNVTNMGDMFGDCSSLTSLDVSGFKTDNVTSMGAMFYGCSALTSLDVSGFNTDNVTDMGFMFYGCSALTSLDVSDFNTDNVTKMEWMFGDCSGLTSLDVSGFKTDKVTNMSDMFADCSSLTSLDVSGFKTDNVTDVSDMFSGCSGLTTLDLSNFNTSKVIYDSYNLILGIERMFSGCSGLTTIYVGDGWTTANLSESSDVFKDCTQLVGGKGTAYDANQTDYTYAHIDGGPSNPGYFTDKNAPADQVATPTFSVSGDYDLAISTQTEDAAIFYTMDGSEPTPQSTLYEGPITLTQDCTVKAIAGKQGYEPSEVAEYVADWVNKKKSLTLELADCSTKLESLNGQMEQMTNADDAPELFELAGTIEEMLTTTTEALHDAYTTENLTECEDYIAEINDLLTELEEAINAYSPTPQDHVATPTFSVSGYTLTISTQTEDAAIFYTMDGSTPTPQSTVYEGPITLTHNCLVRAIATKEGMLDSEEASLEIDELTMAMAVPSPVITREGDEATIIVPSISDGSIDRTPNVSVEPASWSGSAPKADLSGEWTCTLFDNDGNATDTYTVILNADGTASFPGQAQVDGSWSYNNNSLTVNHYIYLTGDNYSYDDYALTTDNPSNPMTFTGTRRHTVGNAWTENNSQRNVTLTFNGTSLAVQSVSTDDNRETTAAVADEGNTEQTGTLLQQTITQLENGYYTVELFAKSVYSSAAPMATDVTYLFANDVRLFIPLEADKEIRQHNVYQIGVEVKDGTLTLGLGKEKNGANWHALQIKSLRQHQLSTEEPMEGAEIHYTTDGSTPTAESTLYNDEPLSFDHDVTIKAIATKDNYHNSEITTFEYVANVMMVATPTFSVSGYTLTISTQTEDAAIFYTMDGLTPTPQSTVYEGPITLTQDCTVLAIAVKQGYQPSEVAEYVADWVDRKKWLTSELSICRPRLDDLRYQLEQKASPNQAPALYDMANDIDTKINDVESHLTEAYTLESVEACEEEVNHIFMDLAALEDAINAYTPTVDQVAAPSFSINGYTLTISTQTEGATIYYTMDGSTPTPQSTNYTGGITLEQDCTVLAIAVKDGYNDSEVAEYVANWVNMKKNVESELTSCLAKRADLENKLGQKATPDQAPNLYNELEYIKLMIDDVAANLSTSYTLADVESRQDEVYIIWERLAQLEAQIETFSLEQDMTATPEMVFNYSTGTLTISCATSGNTIYYNIGTGETITYMGQLTLTDNVTVTAYATAEGYNTSETVTFKPIENGTRDGDTFRIRGEVTTDELLFLRNIMGQQVEHLDMEEAMLTSGELYPETFGGMSLLSARLPRDVGYAGERLFNGCRRLAAVVWNAEAELSPMALQGIDNPNLLLYVNSDKIGSATGITNLVVNQVAKEIVLSDPADTEGTSDYNFYCPIPFTAQKISYSHTYNQQSGIDGECRGWETIALPFNVQTITHRVKGDIAPFGAQGLQIPENAPRFWLCELGRTRFENATAIEANTPYIISMPQHPDYDAYYNLGGDVITFAATQTLVPMTNPRTATTGQRTIYANFTTQPAADRIYTMNVGEAYDATHAEGSVFVQGQRAVRPFEAYTTSTNGARYIDLFGEEADGIVKIVNGKLKTDNYVYDLSGRRINDNHRQSWPKNRLVIKNGKVSTQSY